MSDENENIDKVERHTSPSRWRKITSELNSSTILSNRKSQPNLPISTMRRIREAILPTFPNSRLANITNPYQYAKEKFNGFWRGAEAKPNDLSNQQSPVSNLTTVRGAIASYWTGEQLKNSLKPSLGIVGLVSFSSVNITLMLEAYAQTLSAVFNDGDVAMGAAKFIGHGIANVIANKETVRLSNKIQKDFSHYLRSQFKEAIVQEPRILEHIQDIHQTRPHDDIEASTPHHAIGRSTEELADNVVDTGVRGFASVSTAIALTYAIAKNSAPIPILGGLETAYLAGGLVATYSAFNYKFGAILGRKAEETLEAQQKAQSKLTENLVKAFDKGKSDKVDCFSDQFDVDNQRLNDKSKEHNVAQQRYENYMQITDFGSMLVSPLPALAALPWGTSGALSAITQQSFLATHAQTQFLLGTVTQGINLIASRGRITVPAKIISEMAQEFDVAREKVRAGDIRQEKDGAFIPKINELVITMPKSL